VRVDAERNLLLVEGGVPGGKGALVLVRQSTKPQKVKGPAGKPNLRKV
jgi:large subunit ribosomal protein L3